MRILALDTSTPCLSAGLYENDRPVWEHHDEGFGGHAERLASVLQRALRGRRIPDRIAVGIGPGSFTGLRVGVATAQALGYAYDRPVVGISSLEAAWWAEGCVRPMEVLADARRGRAYVCRIGVRGRPSRPVLETRDAAGPVEGVSRLWVGTPAPEWGSPRGADAALSRLARGVARAASKAALSRERKPVVPLYVLAKDCNVTLGGSARRTLSSLAGGSR
ncbi:MAG: hypothetical protein MOGMAGMI_01190 [Candidatus Omnitrophica bacterium]|nr:hypothetical protein [Candidatus Omnitrophota bacterium]